MRFFIDSATSDAALELLAVAALAFIALALIQQIIGRVGDDVFEIPLFALWINDILGMLFFGVTALAIMLSINAQITAIAVVPFIFVGVVAAAAATSRIERYRRASRRSNRNQAALTLPQVQGLSITTCGRRS